MHNSITRISDLSRALSEEIRVRILICLQGGPLGLQHFVDIFQLAPSTLSKHLHILENAGLLVSVRQGRWRLYQWPESDGNVIIGELLDWLGRAASKDRVLKADWARRAVAIENNPVLLPPGELIRVLFLCTGNSCRSQMAEALLRARSGSRIEVASAGVAPREIPPLTYEVMSEINIDISSQRPKSVMDFIGKTHFDYLITVCSMAEQYTPVFPGVTSRLHWPVEDPAEARGTKKQRKDVFRDVRDHLDASIADWLDNIQLTRRI